MKKRLAVCFYGQVRFVENFNLFYPYLQSQLVDFEVDYFISTWDDFDRSKIELDFIKEDYVNEQRVVKGWKSGNTQKMAYLLSKVGILKRQYELDNDISYNFVLTVRPDTIFDIAAFIQRITNIDSATYPNPTVFTGSPLRIEHNYYKVDSDWIYLMTSDAFDIHTTLYNFFYQQRRYKNRVERYIEGGHWIHAYYFKHNNFAVETLEVPNNIVRPVRDLDILKEHYNNPELMKLHRVNEKLWELKFKEGNPFIIKDGIEQDLKGKIN